MLKLNMANEIERKFFVRELPDLKDIIPIRSERYFIGRDDNYEERITKVGNRYFYEKKVSLSDLERTREKREITEAEFDRLKEGLGEALIRETYPILSVPKTDIQIYHGRFEGLVRAEVEFDSQAEADAYLPLPWMGAEMTGMPIARDARLLDLSKEEFRSLARLG